MILATTENLYDLLPTIRSRSFVLQMWRLSDAEMREFAEARKLADTRRGSRWRREVPGLAASLNLDQYRERRGLIMAAFECGAGLRLSPSWVQQLGIVRQPEIRKAGVVSEDGVRSAGRSVIVCAKGVPAVRNRDIENG